MLIWRGKWMYCRVILELERKREVTQVCAAFSTVIMYMRQRLLRIVRRKSKSKVVRIHSERYGCVQRSDLVPKRPQLQLYEKLMLCSTINTLNIHLRVDSHITQVCRKVCHEGE